LGALIWLACPVMIAGFSDGVNHSPRGAGRLVCL